MLETTQKIVLRCLELLTPGVNDEKRKFLRCCADLCEGQTSLSGVFLKSPKKQNSKFCFSLTKNVQIKKPKKESN